MGLSTAQSPKQSERGKAARDRYKKSERGRARDRRYWQSEVGLACRRRYGRSDVGLAATRARTNRKMRGDASRRIDRTLKGQIWLALKGRKAGRSWETIVGYALGDLTRHLESLFRPGMSWDNYGKYGWHIDHIRPRHLFKYSSDEDIRKCWALSNLQPLWAWENWLKGSMVLEPEKKKAPEPELQGLRGL